MEQFANRAHSTLSASIAPGDLSLVVGDGTSFPSSGNFRIVIDDEIIIVGARTGATLSSLTRGAEGTTASTHAAGAAVTHVLTVASSKLLPVDHSVLTNVGTDQHHAQAHAIGGADHTGSLAHSSLGSVTADQHHAQSHVHLADGSGTVAHTSLSTVGTDDHHAKSHAHSGDGSGTVDHSSLAGVTANQHHGQSHGHTGADSSGTVAHGDLTGVSANQHHNQSHSVSDHTTAVSIKDEGVAQGDALTLDFTGTGITASVAGGVATISAAAASGGYHTIYDEGSSLTQRNIANFTGDMVTASDDAVNARTNVDTRLWAGTSDLVDVGSTESAGTAVTVPRGDHGHALGVVTTKGDILTHNGTSAARQGAGVDGTFLIASSGSGTGLAWRDHEGLSDPHTGYRLESADHSHASSGLQGGTVAHTALTSVGANDHHAQSHGASDHTDRTRSIYVIPNDMTANRGAPAQAQGGGGTDDAIDWWAIPDAATGSVSFQIVVPADWVSGALSAVIIYSQSVVNNNFRCRLDYAYLASGDLTTEVSASTSFTLAASGTGSAVSYSSGQSLGTPDSTGELLRINFARIGADALDTNTGSMRLLAIRIDYTADS